jgi:threonine aldolase
MKVIDLRSDTVTHPTSEMRRAMAEAEVGDDVFGEDPTVNELEATAAVRMGKEEAVLVASGSMGNLVSALSHCQRGDEMVVGSEAHIFHNEVGSVSGMGGIHVRTVPNGPGGMMDPEQVELAMRLPGNIHHPRTALVCLENTHNRCGGGVLNTKATEELAELAHRHDAAVHIDGARIFNAAVYLNVPPAELVREADTVSFCLSKGLSCPIGSLVCGSREVISLVRKNRKAVGGGMRQAGIIAAAGLVALEHMVDRLHEDHSNALALASGLASISCIILDPESVQTNIVIFEVTEGPALGFIEGLKEAGLLVSSPGPRLVRMVTHIGISNKDIEETLNIVQTVAKGASNAFGR